jgi:outer membrane protein OmpA-like peptidoglycan-associated protein
VAKPVRSVFIFFDFGQEVLVESDTVARILDTIVEIAKAEGVTRIEVVGHTDTALVASLSAEISRARAEAVKTALVARGLPSSAITTRGEGKSQPLVNTGDGKKEPQNRRVEVQLYK